MDDAAAYLGNWLEGQLDKVEGKTAEATEAMQNRLLERLLSGKSRFADPLESGKVVKNA